MKTLLIFLISLAPGLVWVCFFYQQDKFEKEPIVKLAQVFIAGAVSVILAIWFETPFRRFLVGDVTLFTHFWISFFVIGLGEEFFKLLALYFVGYSSPEFNEPVDGIIYGTTVGIGFSVVENMLYIINYGLEVAPIRALIASLAHASFSGIAGTYLGRAKFSQTPFLELFKGLVLASCFHGLYDFILISEILSPFVAIGLVILVYLLLQRYIRQALQN
ncbi:MAG: PrsW family intramembrane metalloprotease [Firmicutes bacterium]|nr:PrsW family intramembrane metalloprotease [Bacillota bacterium]